VSVFPPHLEPLEDIGPASWVEEALANWPAQRFRVRDLVPPVFEAYARILHGACRVEHNVPTSTWAELADSGGVQVGPETSWEEVVGVPRDTPEWDGSVPEEGLNEPELVRLVPLLERHARTPERCWFLLWSGYGFLRETGSWQLTRAETDRRAEMRERRGARAAARRDARFFERFARVELLGRRRTYFLLSGAVGDAARFRFLRHLFGSFQSPNLWWPDDRAWFIHTEIDGYSTYLGGSQALVDELVGSQALESLEVEADMLAAG